MEPFRCDWCLANPTYIAYHDDEWGVPIFDDHKLFEALLLETFQAGLSWWAILKKREHFREAFHDFDLHRVAQLTAYDVEKLLLNKGIIRNKGKITAAITNARSFIEIQKEVGSFSEYMWSFTNGVPIQNRFEQTHEIPQTTALAIQMSNDLKKRGFKYIGKITMYAHMQAVGMVNDHVVDCFRHKEIAALSPNN
ncbi:MAG: DNA-3-methyladenine glycosylase I [Bacteroidetes bacterium]|nr:DNA-3-methyladenine glycosylase I [Bacteroidota bacterium]